MFMKKFLLLIYIFILNFCNGQIDCNIKTTNSCNFIQNPTFQSSTTQYGVTSADAFRQNLVPYWYNSHGTCDLNPNVFSPTPVANTNIAAMVNCNIPQWVNSLVQEGLVGKIRKLTTGRRYALSFFIQTADIPGWYGSYDVRMNVNLINCQNIADSAFSSYIAPPVPSQSQRIFCQDISIVRWANWSQIFVEFTANNDYDMIWFYPEFINAPRGEMCNYYGIVYPELIDITNYSISTETNPVTCTATLTADCGVSNAEYIWKNSSGTIVGSGQQITINAAANSGNYTVNMTVPTALLTNNSCSINNPTVSTTTSLQNCTPCGPEITPKGVLEVLTDCDIATSFQLTSNISQNCQWYENGIAIPGANSPILTLGTGTYVGTKLYTVENTNAIGCISEPTQVIRTQVNTGCSINNVFNSPHYYCRGVSGIISQPVISGINPIYSWEFNYPYNSPIAPTQSNTSYVTFNSNNDHLVKAIAQAQDYTRFYFYGIDITPHLYQNPNNGNNYSLWFAPSCQSTGLTVTYGNSGYDNEYYDFGSGASIATYSSSGNVGLQSLIVYYSTPGTKTITVTYSNNSGDCNTILYAAPIDGSCRVVGNIPKSTSAIIEEKNDVTVFPNPASKFVNLVAQKSKMNELYVYSIDSKLVKSITIKGEVKYKLDVQDLRNGIYYLRIITSNGSFLKKIIVNN